MFHIFLLYGKNVKVFWTLSYRIILRSFFFFLSYQQIFRISFKLFYKYWFGGKSYINMSVFTDIHIWKQMI